MVGSFLVGSFSLSALCEIVQRHDALDEWTDETAVEYLALPALQSHLGYDWSCQLNVGLLVILDEYKTEDGDFGE